VNVDAVLAELPQAHRTIAETVLNGGVPAVRAAGRHVGEHRCTTPNRLAARLPNLIQYNLNLHLA
jgi:hypothetical protein